HPEGHAPLAVHFCPVARVVRIEGVSGGFAVLCQEAVTRDADTEGIRIVSCLFTRLSVQIEKRLEAAERATKDGKRHAGTEPSRSDRTFRCPADTDPEWNFRLRGTRRDFSFP